MMPRLVCLVPARNAADRLPALLESAERFCDAVVALDDGSADETGDILRAHPIVGRLLSNPRRETYFGWDDGANRNRLLAEAATLDPDWVISVDADERLEPTDGAALRAFLAADALPGLAYGFRLYRMVDEDTYDPDHTVVHRLFRYRPGQRFPDARLWCTPVPRSIPPAARVETTLRIQHFGELGDIGTQRRLAKHAEADPQGAFRRPSTGLAWDSARLHPRWEARPADLPVLGLERAPNEAPPASRRPAMVVCLLAARNCEEDLPAWFESARRVADTVVALDDGSTDRTAEVLEAEPLVEVLLRSPRREGFYGWDDSANRNRLLEAADALFPDWILSLDADERIAAEDAVVLRRFIDEEARPGFAYGFPVYRMIGDTGHYDRVEMTAFRLFGFAEGQAFPSDRLHFSPVPTSIPRANWKATTVRIQHLSALTEARRQARWEKYLESDAGNEWERDYTYALVPPGQVKPWLPRPADLPVLSEGVVEEWVLAELDLEGPQLSVVVVRGPQDEGDVLKLVQSLAAEEPAMPTEVLVVDTTGDGTAELIRERHPSVSVMTVDPRATDAQARDLGVRTARGDFVLVLRPGDRVEPGGLDLVAEAHESGHALVTGTVVNGRPSLSGWVSYFLDHAASLEGGAEGSLSTAPGRASAPRDGLVRLGLGRGGDEGGLVRPSEKLFGFGFTAVRGHALIFRHEGSDQAPSEFLRARFRRGRALERSIEASGASGEEQRTARAGLLGVRNRQPLIRAGVVHGSPEVRAAYRRVSALVWAGLASTWAGGVCERSLGMAAGALESVRRRPAVLRSGPEPGAPIPLPLRTLPRAAGSAVALTFDDGPQPGITDALLDELAEQGVRVTFFVVGSAAERHPEIVSRALAEGHGIGVHGWDHTRLSGGGRTGRRQLERTVAVLRDHGAHPRLFRPPYGRWDEALVRDASALGLTTVTWSVDPQDWRQPGTQVIVDRVRTAVRPGSIIILHDGRGDRSQTVAALPLILDQLRALHLPVVDLGEHLDGDKVAAVVAGRWCSK